MNKAARAADWRERDPQYQHEQNAYAEPVPSRILIIDDLTQQSRPMTRAELIELYALVDDQAIEAFDHRLRAMLRDGQLLENRRGALGPIDKMDLVRGRIQGHRDGFGFLIPENTGEDDVFLNPRQMRMLMHGDRVVVRIVGRDPRGRREGRIARFSSASTSAWSGGSSRNAACATWCQTTHGSPTISACRTARAAMRSTIKS